MVEGLGSVVEKLEEYLSKKNVLDVTAKLIASAEQIGTAASGSWLGYQACVYYEHFQKPPLGAVFSIEWGMKGFHGMGTTGAWCEYQYSDVVELINSEAGNPDLSEAENYRLLGISLLAEGKDLAEVELRLFLNDIPDPFIEDILSKVLDIKPLAESDFIKLGIPKGSFTTKDTRAAEGRLKTPPHFNVMAKSLAYGFPAEAVARLIDLLKKADSYIKRSRKMVAKDSMVGTNIFIGHGRSPVWRDLKDFISERLRLPYDEFNRVPVAGITNIARLSEMLESAAVAFVVMTGEDELVDGTIEARTNVIHEVGLFQGRLGFTKAIVLLEEGCEEFSNIHGLGQIRFPKGNISAKFEEIRQVLEREGVLQ
ncbi:TIR domain-containing protein [Pseudomonas putida]|uniref:TIR domain-containing protein n=1 Tax=Pseudomonas putida TaxID=303 RepID=UPI0003172F5D|nr:TIR domain-containing protein [Pseudomonas putida]ANC80080.1 hypothetical protein KKK_03280 [Pseudomonas putida B6-2]